MLKGNLNEKYEYFVEEVGKKDSSMLNLFNEDVLSSEHIAEILMKH